MFNYDYSKKTRTIIQIISSIMVFLYLINIGIMLKKYNSSYLIWQIIYYVCLAYSVYALVRMCMKRTFKLESIAYYILNVVSIVLISHAVLFIGANGHISIGVGHLLNYILFSIPQMVLVSILSIVGIIKTCVSKSKQEIISSDDLTK